MKYLYKKFIFLAMIAAMLLTACNKDYLDLTDDPNRPTDDNITPEAIFPQAAEATGNLMGNSLFQFLNNWMGYFAANGDFARNQIETSYDLDFGFSEPVWQQYYNTLFDLHQVKTKALTEADGDVVIAGASMILSAKLLQDLVDLYGDIPYSQAFQPLTYAHPVYDKQQDIYKDLQLVLDTAISYMQETPPKTKPFAPYDIINHGDQDKWIRFANTLKLRLLIRQSEVSGFNPAAEIAKIQSNGGILQAGESISVNPGYSNELNKQNPFYSNYGYTPTGNKATTSENANAYIIDKLYETADPRIERYFTPVGNDFIGDIYGDQPGNIPNGASSSYFGEGIAASAEQGQWILPSFESLFFYAEAAARGWFAGVDVETAYRNAVIENFKWLGVEDAQEQAEYYLDSSEDSAPYANFSNAGSTHESQARFIAFQKYIALCGTDPLEAYCDERRLNFLPPGYISVNSSRVSNKLPLRMLYVQTEYTANAESVKAVGSINPFTTKLFWQP